MDADDHEYGETGGNRNAMKRILTMVLCIVMMITAVTAFADELKLSTKLQRQMQHDGNGEKGKLTLTGNADAAEYPLLSAIQNADYSILRNASGEQWHIVIYQAEKDDEGRKAATSEYYYDDGFYTRSGVAGLSAGAMFDGKINESTEFFDIDGYDLTLEELKELISENKEYINGILTSKYTEESLGDEYYFLSIITDFNDWYGQLSPAVIPISNEMLIKISNEFGYLEKNASHFETDNLKEIRYDSTDISVSDKEDTEYMLLLLKDSYFRETGDKLLNKIGGYIYYSGIGGAPYIIDERADVDFVYYDGESEAATILCTERANGILGKKAGGE